MKPGATKLFNYLKENDSLKIIESANIHPFWTVKAISRFAQEYSDVFFIEDGIIKLKKVEDESKKVDLSPYVNVRSNIVSQLEKLLVGPLVEDEVLGSKKNPMTFYLTGKLVPFGSTSDVINEEENEIETKQLLEDEKMDEMIINRHVFRPSSMGFSFKMKSLSPITIKISWGMYDDEQHKKLPLFMMNGRLSQKI